VVHPRCLDRYTFGPKVFVSANESFSLSSLTRLLRGCGCRQSKLAFSDKHQVADVYQRVREIGQDPDGIPFKNEVETHDHAPTDAPIPERYRNHAFTLPLGCDPLNKETHRENGVPDQTKDDEITPVQAKEPIFLADPGDSNDCKYVHKRLTDSAIS
jgi:hypothetical protein